MRAPIIIVSLIFVMVAGSYSIQYALDTTSKKLSVELTRAQKQINKGKLSEARRTLSTLTQRWRKVENGWALITDHREMDQIDMTLVRMDSLLKEGQVGLALTELSAMQRLVNHIPEKERFNLKNLL